MPISTLPKAIILTQTLSHSINSFRSLELVQAGSFARHALLPVRGSHPFDKVDEPLIALDEKLVMLRPGIGWIGGMGRTVAAAVGAPFGGAPKPRAEGRRRTSCKAFIVFCTGLEQQRRRN